MYRFFLKYKAVILNAIILIALFSTFVVQNNNLKDGMLGFAFGITLVMFGESIADLKGKKVDIERIGE